MPDFTTIGIIVVVVVFLALTLRVLNQYEEGVILNFGRYSRRATPGLNLIIPLVERLIKTDVRIQTLEVPHQDVITGDNVSVKVTAVAYFKVEDAKRALLDVEDYEDAVDQLTQTTLRSTIGKHKLDELLSRQEGLNKTLRDALEERAKSWGILIDHVEIRSVDLDASMVRAMAQEAEAERGRRARIITAEGEYEAAKKLSEAAEVLAKNPAALTLRTLATIKEVGAEHNTTILFPIDMAHLIGPQVANAALAKAIADGQSATQTQPGSK